MCSIISRPIKTSIDSCSNKTIDGKFIQSGFLLPAGYLRSPIPGFDLFYGLNNCLLSNNHTFMNQLASFEIILLVFEKASLRRLTVRKARNRKGRRGIKEGVEEKGEEQEK